MSRKLFAAILLMSMSIACAHAQSFAPKDLPVRVELHPIHTMTLTDQQFLTGDRAGKPVTVSGELSIAQGTGKLPVVVLMHGSGGAGSNVQHWKRTFNAMGISTFVIDSVSGRGLMGVGDNQALLGRLNYILDIYSALPILAKHPRVDASRIMLMGFSRGGQAALYASNARFQKMWNGSGVDFVAYVPFYPDCATTYRDDTDVVPRPIRIFHGTPDNYNPVRTCKAYVQRLKEAKVDVELTEYPNAQHGFDSPLGSNPPVPAVRDQTVRECTIKEGEGGALVNQATGAQFTYKDECVRLGPTVGYDPEATQQATVAVTQFVKAVLKL